MSKSKYCYARWYRTFTIAGLLTVRRHISAEAYCTMPVGHDGDHKGWLDGYPRKAMVVW